MAEELIAPVDIWQLIEAKRPIDCGALAQDVGYPAGYAFAEEVLRQHGWFYFITHDAWFPPGERPPHG